MKAVTNEKIIFHYVVVSFYILLANIMKHYENALVFWNEQNKYSLSNLKPAFICAHMYEQRIYVHIYATTMFECMTYQHDLTHRDMNEPFTHLSSRSWDKLQGQCMLKI